MKKLFLLLCLTGCNVTPSDREVMYSSFAHDHTVKCAAYRFDRSNGLTPEVPAMTKACQ